MAWTLRYSKEARKDAERLHRARLGTKAAILLEIMAVNPFQNPPPYEKLSGELRGRFSRRINIHHRIVYEVIKKEKIVNVLRMWTHYE
ncbi:MAG: Txe/YoeB family addiction module toxin [Pyrinomonadaceae bacterium]|nr:Txe/YoeB family addiction module toxin [Pyrinomonadaceae bacterium]